MNDIEIKKTGKASPKRKDWMDEGDVILAYFKKSRLKYRKKICTKCIGTQQQKDRNCFVVSEAGHGLRNDGTLDLDKNGNPKTYCNHQTVAINKDNHKIIHAHINSAADLFEIEMGNKK